MKPAREFLLLTLCLASAAASDVGDPTTVTDTLEPSGAMDQVEQVDLTTLRDVFVEIGDFNGALSPAQQIVDQTSREVGEADPKLVPELNALAGIQREIGEYALAEANYLRSVNILENSNNNKFPPELIEPYHGLGKTFIATQRFGDAMTVLDQARHISRRNLGLFNIDQAGIIDDQTVALVGLGDTVTALELQQTRLNLAVRTFGDNNPAVVPYHYHLADYYMSSRMKNRAHDQYQKATEVLETNVDEHAAELLPPLTAIIALNNSSRDKGAEAVRIRSILDNNETIDPSERAFALTSLGDWHLVRLENIEDAFSYYRAAYEAAPIENREAMFSVPALLNFIAPITALSQRKARRSRSAIGQITLAFTVEPDGSTSDARVVAANPPDLMEADYLERLAVARFRPRFVKGVPVETQHTQMSHRFWYFVEN